MKILMYGWEYPPYISGGLGMACQGLATSLAKHDIKISLALPKVDNVIVKEKNINVLDYHLLGKTQALTSQHHSSSLKNFPLFSCYDTKQISCKDLTSLTNFLNRNVNLDHAALTGKYDNNLLFEVLVYARNAGKFAEFVAHDIIHAHDWLTILAGVHAKSISKKPFVLHVHSLEYDRNGENVNPLIYEIEKYGMQHADKIVAVSHYTKNMIQQHYGISADKISVVYNGLFEEQLHAQRPSSSNGNFKIVTFLGRITHQKGPRYFILAVNKILSRRKDVKFVMAGEGDQLRHMIDHTAWLRQGRNILFTGFLNQEQVKRVYSLSDVYVMPSTSEPFGISCLEALSNNVPVIISKQSGVSEVVKHTFKVDFWDVDDIATKIIGLLDYPLIKKEQFRHVNQELQSLKWEDSARNLINIYKRVLES